MEFITIFQNYNQRRPLLFMIAIFGIILVFWHLWSSFQFKSLFNYGNKYDSLKFRTDTTFIWPKIYFYGDSLTERAFSKEGCWASIIADEYKRKADIIARGFSGYTSRMSRGILPFLINDLKDVSVAAILLGTNDANDPTSLRGQHVDLKEYKDNIRFLVHEFKKANIKSLFLITPPASTEVKDVSQYADACLEIAKEEKIRSVDLYYSMIQQDDWKEMLSDGVHFTPKGCEFVASVILPILSKCFEDINYSVPKRLWPEYSSLRRLDSKQIPGTFENYQRLTLDEHLA